MTVNQPPEGNFCLSPFPKKAHTLCSDVDQKDTPFIALALFLNIPLITRDKKLINALKEKDFENIIALDSVLK